jgi:hypothetical protein
VLRGKIIVVGTVCCVGCLGRHGATTEDASFGTYPCTMIGLCIFCEGFEIPKGLRYVVDDVVVVGIACIFVESDAVPDIVTKLPFLNSTRRSGTKP